MDSLCVKRFSTRDLEIIAELSDIKLEKDLKINEISDILNEFYDEVYDE